MFISGLYVRMNREESVYLYLKWNYLVNKNEEISFALFIFSQRLDEEKNVRGNLECFFVRNAKKKKKKDTHTLTQSIFQF